MSALKFLYFAILSTLSFNSIAQKHFVIKGEIDRRMDNKTIMVSQVLPSYSSIKNPTDLQTVIKDGKFTFNVRSDGFELYSFRIDHQDKKYSCMIGLSPRDIKIVFPDTLLTDYIFQNGSLKKEYEIAKKKLRVLNHDTTLLIKGIEKIIKRPFASYFVFSYSYKLSEYQTSRLCSMIPEVYRKNSWGIDLKLLIGKFLIGKPAPDFSQLSPNGETVRLSDYKGKYVLLDFWASWCVPCRKENPSLVKSYADFNKKGFEILGISLDSDKVKWVEAISTDGLIWKHVSDLNGWGNIVSRNLYNVKSIPQNYLVDPKSNIIAKDLFGDKLYAYLSKLEFRR